MWLRVATDEDSVRIGKYGNKYVDGQHIEEFFFDDKIASALTSDRFLEEMWEHFDALFDWGDCDFFTPDKCQKLLWWLKNRLQKKLPEDVRTIYEVLLDYAQKAITNNTGIYFDF